MSIRRLILGFSLLAMVVGLLTAAFAPGGWSSAWAPGSYRHEPFSRLVEQLGFARGTYVPFGGLVLSLLGAIGLVVGWAIRPSKARKNDTPVK